MEAAPSDALDQELTDQTVRMVISPNPARSRLRVHLSNRLLDAPLYVPHATIGRAAAIASSVEQAERLFRAARARGVPVRRHAEQRSNQGGTLMAARHGALSCDHLEYAGEREAAALAAAGSVAVLLPVAFYCLASRQLPPVAALRAAGAAIAVASDCNPGSAPGTSLLTAMSMATRLFGLTTDEALLGVTHHAAQALALGGTRGVLAPGQAADFVVWNIGSPAELGYWIGFNPRRTVVRGAEILRWPNQTP